MENQSSNQEDDHGILVEDDHSLHVSSNPGSSGAVHIIEPSWSCDEDGHPRREYFSHDEMKAGQMESIPKPDSTGNKSEVSKADEPEEVKESRPALQEQDLIMISDDDDDGGFDQDGHDGQEGEAGQGGRASREDEARDLQEMSPIEGCSSGSVSEIEVISDPDSGPAHHQSTTLEDSERANLVFTTLAKFNAGTISSKRRQRTILSTDDHRNQGVDLELIPNELHHEYVPIFPGFYNPQRTFNSDELFLASTTTLECEHHKLRLRFVYNEKLYFTELNYLIMDKAYIRSTRSNRERRDLDALSLWIQLKRPCQVFELQQIDTSNSKNSTAESARRANPSSTKRYAKHEVKSPFNLVTFGEALGKPGIRGLILNSWNLRQVFFFKGMCSPSQFSALKEVFSFAGVSIIDADRFLCREKGLSERAQEYGQRAEDVRAYMSNMQGTLPLDILALNSKFDSSIFGSGIDLPEVSKLLQEKLDRQETIDTFSIFLNDALVRGGSLLIREWLSFTTIAVSSETRAQANSELTTKQFIITPTLVLVEKNVIPESNRVLRLVMKQDRPLSCFAKVNFCNEFLKKHFFNGKKNSKLLDYYEEVLREGIVISYVSLYSSRSSLRPPQENESDPNSVSQQEEGAGDGSSEEELEPSSSGPSNDWPTTIKFEFFGYNNSQFKAHHFWFFSEAYSAREQVVGPISKAEFVRQLGDFDGEPILLKRQSRLGQCFTMSTVGCRLQPSQIEFGVPDIEHNGCCFSDGCGSIHPTLARIIGRNLFDDPDISAFQIRIGGAKGVIRVDQSMMSASEPSVIDLEEDGEGGGDSLPEGKLLMLRKSQVKFPTAYEVYDIEICEHSKFSQGFLNRQIIVLLNSLGIPSRTFKRLQDEAIELFIHDQASSPSWRAFWTQARQLLKTVAPLPQDFKDQAYVIYLSFKHQNPGYIFHPETNLHEKVATEKESNEEDDDQIVEKMPGLEEFKRAKAGAAEGGDIGYWNKFDPLMATVQKYQALKYFQDLKERSRILIPKSTVLIGVIDTDNVLEEGQVFVRITRDCKVSPHNKRLEQALQRARIDEDEYIELMKKVSLPQVLEGPVIVTRCPCHFPGDIRKMTAVNHPKLAYLKNVIVFSSKGTRPAQEMMSGGDLDGDQFFIFWDPRLFFDQEVPPADLGTEAKNPFVERAPDSNEISKHVRFFLERDSLGRLSNEWLSLADTKSASSPECLQLALFLSIFVDFQKHGTCVREQHMAEIQRLFENGKAHYLQKSHGGNYFKATSCIGTLFDSIDLRPYIDECKRSEFHSYQNQQFADEDILDIALALKSQDEERFECLNTLQHSLQGKVISLMSKQLKKIMLKYRVTTETQLLGTVSKTGTNVFLMDKTGLISRQHEHLLASCSDQEQMQVQVKALVENHKASYYKEADLICKKNEEHHQTAPLALYLASYIMVQRSASSIHPQQKMTFPEFCVIQRQIAQGSLAVHKKFLDQKVFLSIPWLLLGKDLGRCIEILKEQTTRRLGDRVRYQTTEEQDDIVMYRRR